MIVVVGNCDNENSDRDTRKDVGNFELYSKTLYV
jgi:hypothetical protein